MTQIIRKLLRPAILDPKPLPTMVANLAVTYRCQNRCRTCNIWRRDAGDELSLDEYQAFFESNRSTLRRVRSIQITGGEPYMREDLPELVALIRRHLPECTFWIPTNGMDPQTIDTATREMLDASGGTGIGVSVSIDGTEPTHDHMRGTPGAFQMATETMDRLTALKQEHLKLGLTVGMTLAPENYGEAPAVHDLARGFGVDFSVRPVNFSDIYYGNLDAGPPLGDASEELLPTLREIARETVASRGVIASTPTLRYLQGVADYIREPSQHLPGCSAGTSSFFMDPQGNVYPCIFVSQRMGNITEESMETFWWSREAQKIREKMSNGRCPGCWVECETYREIHRDKKGLALPALRALIDTENRGIN